jgi:glycosyltransferase involved in cell wall biosynthesis
MVAELVAAGVPYSRIVHLPNGVETEEFAPRPDYALHDPPTVIYVGRLHPQKGIGVLLEAAARLRASEAIDFRIVLVGDGPAGEELRLQARCLGLGDGVQFAGATERVAEHLQAADIFVLPSRSEGLSNALLEAMASGLPVVATAIPGNVDVITHGRNGMLVAVDDPEALASACAGLLGDRSRREELGRAARMTVEARYSLDRVARDYLALYRALVPPGTGTAHLPRA